MLAFTKAVADGEADADSIPKVRLVEDQSSGRVTG